MDKRRCTALEVDHVMQRLIEGGWPVEGLDEVYGLILSAPVFRDLLLEAVDRWRGYAGSEGGVYAATALARWFCNEFMPKVQFTLQSEGLVGKGPAPSS